MSKYFVIQGVWLTIRVRGRSGGEIPVQYLRRVNQGVWRSLIVLGGRRLPNNTYI